MVDTKSVVVVTSQPYLTDMVGDCPRAAALRLTATPRASGAHRASKLLQRAFYDGLLFLFIKSPGEASLVASLIALSIAFFLPPPSYRIAVGQSNDHRNITIDQIMTHPTPKTPSKS